MKQIIKDITYKCDIYGELINCYLYFGDKWYEKACEAASKLEKTAISKNNLEKLEEGGLDYGILRQYKEIWKKLGIIENILKEFIDVTDPTELAKKRIQTCYKFIKKVESENLLNGNYL